MPLISASNLHKRYGHKVVLAGASLTVEPGEKVGLVGPNGSGKTTLLRILADEIPPDEGEVSRLKGLKVAYLPQVPELPPEQTVEESARHSLQPIARLEEEAHRLAERAAKIDDPHLQRQLLHRHDELLEQFRRLGGYRMDARLDQVLAGLGLGGEMRRKRVRELSGGERSRVAIARLLLIQPDLLLLDEPTNHLDIEAIEWLEEFLTEEPNALLVVSHDRYLLDRLVNRIVELRSGRTTSYPGNYSAYEAERRRRLLTHQRLYRKQQAHIAREEEFIRRYHAGQRAREARGRARKLARLERLPPPPPDPEAPSLHITPPYPGSELVVECRNLTKSFGSRTLFRNLSLTLTRGDRLAVVGPNGSGKSTLLRILAGREAPTAGSARLGRNIRLAFVDQELSDLVPSRTVLEEARGVRSDLSEEEVRTFLGRFLFRGEEVFVPVEELSGGERARLALAKAVLAQPNLLLLDEPTNHLDIYAREALEEALSNYPGTLVVVSHDRYLLNRLARQVLHLADGQARLYPGDYDLFRRLRQQEGTDKPTTKPTGKRPRPPAKPKPRKRRPLYSVSLEELEAQIIAKEEEVKALAEELGRPETYRHPERARQLQADYQRATTELEELNHQWETRVEELEG